MTTILDTYHHQELSLSLRVMRVLLFLLIVAAIATELTLSMFWLVGLSILAIYNFITGVFGRDPVFALLKLTSREIPRHVLSVAAQLECLIVGLACIIVGITLHHRDSLVLPLLPFIGIYPILLCAVKHDLLGYLLHSYRSDKRRDTSGLNNDSGQQ